ncbi:MAG: restriction endonuclease subunit S, partial [Hyphomonadaceae bacterium]|nr:restriction endonuclease subunit S [Hyphomonadaceae bacterium]
TTLGTLDDKIELNRRMNETLEAMARAFFRDWFVDFGPTRARMEGRDPYLAPDLWALFPDTLDAETGLPKGWVKASIHDFSEVVYGAPFASRQFNSGNVGVPLIRIRDLATHSPGVSTEQTHKKGHMIEPGDIVVGMDGEFRLHIWKGPKAWLNQRVCHFEPKHGIPRSFLAESLKEPLAFFERSKTGTTVIHLGKSDIDTIKLTHPGDGVLGAFASIVEPMLERSVTNALESRTLAAIRDLLLPRLISGEIRLREAEQAMEAGA